MDSQTLAKEVLQYGILGVVAVSLAYFAFSQWKNLEKRNENLEKKVDKLQEEMKQLTSEDRERMMMLIADNTRAINDMSRIIIEYIADK